MAQVPLLETQHTAEFLVSYAAGHRSFDRGTLIAGQNLSAGAVLGKIMFATPATPVVVGTGNGVMSAISPGPKSQLGNYVVTFTGATAFGVTAPDGETLPAAAALGAYTDAQINFTITAGGTAFVAGDKFTVVNVAGSLKYTSYLPTATDGSGVPAGVLYGNTNATSADTKQTIVVRDAEVNASELKWDASLNAAAILVGITGLSALGIIAR
jgi:Bacteriophage lambda head decoration protein D